MLLLQSEAVFGSSMVLSIAFTLLFIVTVFGFFAYNYTQVKMQNTIMSVKDEFKTIIMTVKEDIVKAGHEHNVAIIQLAHSVTDAIAKTTQAKMEFDTFVEQHEKDHFADYRKLVAEVKVHVDGQKVMEKSIRDLIYKAKTLDERLRDLASNGNGSYVEKKNFEPLDWQDIKT